MKKLLIIVLMGLLYACDNNAPVTRQSLDNTDNDDTEAIIRDTLSDIDSLKGR